MIFSRRRILNISPQCLGNNAHTPLYILINGSYASRQYALSVLNPVALVHCLKKPQSVAVTSSVLSLLADSMPPIPSLLFIWCPCNLPRQIIG